MISILLTCLHLWNIACRLPEAEKNLNKMQPTWNNKKKKNVKSVILDVEFCYVITNYVLVHIPPVSFMVHVHSYRFVR